MDAARLEVDEMNWEKLGPQSDGIDLPKINNLSKGDPEMECTTFGVEIAKSVMQVY